MNKTIIAIVIVAVVLVGGYFLFKGTSEPTLSVPQTSNQQTVPQLSAEQAPIAERNEVIYTNDGYSPTTLTVKRGETIAFKNQSSQSMWPASAMHPTHRVYSGTSLSEHCPDAAGKAFDACKGFLPGESWSFKFDKTGIWKYHNHLSPVNTGTIVVE